MTVSLVGLTGKAGCGKDTLAAAAKWSRAAFADSLKEMCVTFLGLTNDMAYTQEGKAQFNPFWGMTNREILQRVGTEAMRNGFHKDVWVKILEIRIKAMLAEGKRVIVTDCRFDNEAEMIRRLGGVVFEIERPNTSVVLNSGESGHPSERGIRRDLISGVIRNDGTVDDLLERFNSLLAGI